MKARKKFYPTLFLFFIICSSAIGATATLNAGPDSIYLKKIPLSTENSFEYILVYKTGKSCFEVYKKKVVNYSIEFKYKFFYSDSVKKYHCYDVYDLTTRTRRSIICNKKDHTFYLSDAYDLKSMGDKLVRKSVDFKKKCISVESTDENGSTKNYIVYFRKLELQKSPDCNYEHLK